MDYRIEKTGEIERLEFSWEGQDENDVAIGRGWAIIQNDQLEGRIYFHLGDDSWFKAKRYKCLCHNFFSAVCFPLMPRNSMHIQIMPSS